MAQGTVRKGFFFYFGLFVLMLVAGFLICLVVMMFSPGTTVLWMQYFTDNKTTHVTSLTGGGTIDYSSVTEITINCNYADVVVQSNKEYVDGDGIYIVNRAKGFTLAKNAVKFSYRVSQNGSHLTIDMTEPKGFLYFSKDIEIIINDYTESVKLNLNNLSLHVNAEGDSNITLGGTTNHEEQNIAPRELDLHTAKGAIYWLERCKTTNLNSVKLSTDSGKIYIKDESLAVNQDVTLQTKSGKISLGALNVGAHEIYLKNTKGSVSAKNLTATKVSVDSVHGNFVIESVNGKFTFEGCEEKIIQPILNITNMNGDFDLSVDNTQSDVAPEVIIGKITGKLNVIARKGKVVVKEAAGAVNVESEYEGKAKLYSDITIGVTNSNLIHVAQEAGNLKMNFKGSVNNVNLKTTTGKITLNFTTAARFTARARKASNTEENVADKNITISIDRNKLDYGTDKANLTIGTSPTGTANIYTNSTITYNLVESI